MRKKFKHMTIKEKIAYIYGYCIWTDEKLATWSQEDRDFYAFRIDTVAEKTLITLAGLFMLLLCGFCIWAILVL